MRLPHEGHWQRFGPEPGKDHSDIWYDVADRVAKITINRPTLDVGTVPERP
jgi:1,4-dihydroxy-2-naphthoyl-CoA synthase